MRRRGLMRFAIGIGMSLLALGSTAHAQAPEDEVRAVNARYFAAVRAHDLKAVGEILLDSPDLLWVVFGKAYWGKDAVLRQFEKNFSLETFRGEEDLAEFRVTLLDERVAHVFGPVDFTWGAAGQPLQSAKIYANYIYLKTAAGWKLARNAAAGRVP